MDQLDLCVKCGNAHQGSCSTEAVYFHWFPENQEVEPQEVCIIGDWNKWLKKQKMTKVAPQTGTYYYSILLALNEGTHEYKFLVDGAWRHDRHANTIYNVYGTLNNIVDILPKKNYMRKVIGQPLKFTSNFCIKCLKIVGSWDNWEIQRQMTKTFNPLKKCEENVIYLDLQPNQTYQFKFKHRNQYFIDQKYPTVTNVFGTLNNIIIVYSNQIHIDTPLKNQITSELAKGKEFNGKVFSWRKIPQMIKLPYERIEGHSMCCIGQYIYIFGGKSRNQFYNTLLKINFSFDKIQFEEIYPDGRAFHIMKPYGNKIIIYGGNNQEVLEDYQAFNVSNRKWHAPPNIFKSTTTKKCQKQSCVLYQALLIFFGGCYNAQNSEFEQLNNEIEVLDLQKMQWIESIHAEGEEPPARFAHTAQMINSFMYVFGGVYDLRNSLNLNDLWRINLLNVKYLRWQKTQPHGVAPQARHGHSMNSVNNFLVIIGGVNDRGEYLNDVFLYNSIQNEWIIPFVQGGLPKPRYNHASTTFLDNQILIFGGRTAQKGRNNQFYLLQPSDFNSFHEIIQNQSDQCE